MKTFSNQVDLTAFFEGFSAKAYETILGTSKSGKVIKDVITIGYGQARTLPNGTPITPDMVCTEQEAKEWLSNRMQKYYMAFLSDPFYCFKGFTNQIHALSDYAYNCGINAFPTLLKHLKAGDIESASHEILDGMYVNKKPLMGLLLRRISNYHTFTTGQYCAFELNDPISAGVKSLLLLKNGHNDAAVEMINRLKVKES